MKVDWNKIWERVISSVLAALVLGTALVIFDVFFG